MELEVSVEKVLRSMDQLDLNPYSEEEMQKTVESFRGMPEGILQDMLEDSPEATIYGMIISQFGHGHYNYDTGVWTPTSDKIYSFDVEVFDIGNMYTLFLQGILSITNSELIIEEIKEEFKLEEDADDAESHSISFLCNGKKYQFDAEPQGDWFDMNCISFMNRILEEQGISKRLWVTGDGYQDCIIFYNTKEWADKFHQCMGYPVE